MSRRTQDKAGWRTLSEWLAVLAVASPEEKEALGAGVLVPLSRTADQWRTLKAHCTVEEWREVLLGGADPARLCEVPVEEVAREVGACLASRFLEAPPLADGALTGGRVLDVLAAVLRGAAARVLPARPGCGAAMAAAGEMLAAAFTLNGEGRV